MDRPGAVAELRAVVAAFAAEFLDTADGWCVALSGGPDSLALTGVAATILPTTALIVDHVVDRVGMARFNTVWTSPETLPRPIEIEYPQRWIDRVL